jgi:predicted GNAT family acetyltransferase
VINSVACTLITTRVSGETPLEPEALFLTVTDDAGEMAGVALQTPPMPVLLSAMSVPAARALARTVARVRPGVPGVNGVVGSVEAFAHEFAATTGGRTALLMSQRMFRLDRVDHPSGVPGEPRAATRADRDVLVAWADAFSAEATPHQPHRDNAAPVDARLGVPGRVWLWQVDGEPVSTAWLSEPVAGITRISGVYTPPARRGRGYASGVVAAASQHALDAGVDACMLYTNLANPTSNKIYQALGYRPVCDASQWIFDPAGEQVA